MQLRHTARFGVFTLSAGLLAGSWLLAGDKDSAYDPTAETLKGIAKLKVKPLDWPQWCGSPIRSNTPQGKDIPTEWNVEDGTNIKWSAKLGSQTYTSPVVANGKVFIGTNNGAGYLKRYPSEKDLGVLLAFDEATGEFLW